jgi:DNA-binding IclR family transcriptional regulator
MDTIATVSRRREEPRTIPAPAAASPPAEARIQSIARAKALLDVLAAADGDWVPLRALASGTGLVKTTAFNLITALVDVGLVERDEKRGAYRLGMQALVYGRAVERRLDIVALMRPHLVKLCAATRETVNLAVPGPADIVLVDSLEGSQSLRVSSYAGTRASYHSTALGRAILAHQSTALRRQIVGLGPLPALTRHTTTDPVALERILEGCRRDGYVSEVEENEEGAACVAAPVFDATGTAVAAVSIAGPVSRLTGAARAEFGRLLVDTLASARRDIAREMGGAP